MHLDTYIHMQFLGLGTKYLERIAQLDEVHERNGVRGRDRFRRVSFLFFLGVASGQFPGAQKGQNAEKLRQIGKAAALRFPRAGSDSEKARRRQVPQENRRRRNLPRIRRRGPAGGQTGQKTTKAGHRNSSQIHPRQTHSW